MTSSRPSIAELRAVSQPPGLLERRSAEHWAGRLYMRRLSPHVTRLVSTTRVTPNALTVLMIVVGLAGAVAAAWPGVLTALAALLGIQAYLLLDCVDGELARWRGTSSPAGVFLDRLGHYVVETALIVALGVRAGGGPSTLGGWAFLGAVASVVMLVGKSQSDLVVVARAKAGLAIDEEAADPQPRQRGLRRLRGLAHAVPIHRIVGAIELTLLLVPVALVDAALADPWATRALVGLVALVAVGVAVVHPVMILTSRRLS